MTRIRGSKSPTSIMSPKFMMANISSAVGRCVAEVMGAAGGFGREGEQIGGGHRFLLGCLRWVLPPGDGQNTSTVK